MAPTTPMEEEASGSPSTSRGRKGGRPSPRLSGRYRRHGGMPVLPPPLGRRVLLWSEPRTGRQMHLCWVGVRVRVPERRRRRIEEVDLAGSRSRKRRRLLIGESREAAISTQEEEEGEAVAAAAVSSASASHQEKGKTVAEEEEEDHHLEHDCQLAAAVAAREDDSTSISSIKEEKLPNVDQAKVYAFQEEDRKNYADKLNDADCQLKHDWSIRSEGINYRKFLLARAHGTKMILKAAKFVVCLSSYIDNKLLRQCSGFLIKWDEYSKDAVILTSTHLIC